MTKLRVLLSLITQENDYQREQAASAEEAARRLGVELQVVYANGEAIIQTKQILGVLHPNATDRPDVIIVEPAGTGMTQVARTANQKNIAWVLMNRSATNLVPAAERTSAPMGCIELDNVEVGRLQGRQFAALLPSGGTVFYIEGPPTDVSKQRRAGVQETMPANIELQAVRGRWTEESGVHAMEVRLKIKGSRPPDVGVIGCQNDAMAMGARKAIEALPPGSQRDLWLQLPFTGCDGVPTSGQLWVQRGSLAATIVSPPLAGRAMDLVLDAITNGRPMTEHTLVNPTSYPPVDQLSRTAAAVAR
jgi:ABC-type sugar transport system substrate-binding protein